jgi:Protein of unknown function (DUF2384)
MAKGWESKSARSKIDAAASRRGAPHADEHSSEFLDLLRKKESLLMSRVRIIRDLENAHNPRYRAVLTKALADLDAQLAIARAVPSLPTEDIGRILAIASAAFDDVEKAGRWLQEPNIQTGNIPPVSLIGTPEGFAVVESVLHQIQYGVFG